jgi:hypothetical protein
MIFSRHRHLPRRQPNDLRRSGPAWARVGLVVPLWVAMSLVVLGAVHAQEQAFGEAPISIIPENVTQATEPAEPVAALVEDIVSAPLTNLDPAGMGLLTPENGGFPATLWGASDFDVVVNLLPLVPANSKSPTMQMLMRRLMLTTATPPQHRDQVASSGTVPEQNLPLLRARVDRLYQAGSLRYLVALFQRLPSMVGDGALAETQANIALLSGDVAQACALSDQAKLHHDALFWLRMQAFCSAVNDDYTGAAFELDMASELGETDQTWLTLMRYLALPPDQREGRQPRSKDVVELSPITLAMMQKAGMAVPPAVLKNADPMMLHVLAINDGTPSALRLQAGQQAAALGALGNRSLGGIYAGVPLQPEELARALNIDADDNSARALATLYQAARLSADVLTRLQLLDMVWMRATPEGGLVSDAQTFGEIAQSIGPANQLVRSAAPLTRALVANGDMNGAVAWYMVLRNAAATRDAQATTDLIGLWPLIQMAGVSNRFPWSTDILDVWWQSQAVYPAAEKNRRALRVFSLFEALGQDIPEHYWLALLGSEANNQQKPVSLRRVPFAALSRMRAAADAGRLGETVMLSMIALGPTGPAGADIVTLDGVLRALVAVGLESEARSLALEAMLGNGH